MENYPPEQQKIVKYLDSLPTSSAGKQSATNRELKLLEKSVLNKEFF